MPSRSASTVRSMPPRLLKTLRAESTAFETFAMMDKRLGKYIHTPRILSMTKGFRPYIPGPGMSGSFKMLLSDACFCQTEFFTRLNFLARMRAPSEPRSLAEAERERLLQALRDTEG